jgi:hypothetical protein
MQSRRLFVLMVLSLTLLLPSIGYALCQSAWLRWNLKLARNLFGPEIRDEPHLFELNKDYVLKIQFDKVSEISGISIIPKYYLQEIEPEWNEPDYIVEMNDDEYREILSKAEKLKSLGSLVRSGSVGIVTGSRLGLLDEYQSAFVRRFVIPTSQDLDGKIDQFHAAYIYFLRRIKGIAKEKRFINQVGMDKQWKLKINDCWYLVTEQEFDKTRLGKRDAFYAAGPLESDSDDECP